MERQTGHKSSRGRKRPGTGPPAGPLERGAALPTPYLGLWPPELVLNHLVCSHSLQQPQETNTRFSLALAISILTPS